MTHFQNFVEYFEIIFQFFDFTKFRDVSFEEFKTEPAPVSKFAVAPQTKF